MPVAAQQAIQFTRPADQGFSNQPSAFLPVSTHQNSASAFNAPSPLFGDKTPAISFDFLPGSPSLNAGPTVNAVQWHKFLEGKRNWTLMTPEQVLGIPTPEKLLGLPDPKDDPTLSAEERFLQRQDRSDETGVTNGFHHPDASFLLNDSAADPFQSSDDLRRFAQTLGGTVPGSTKNPNPLFKMNSEAPQNFHHLSESAWASPFGSSGLLPKPTPEQQEGMDRFRAMLEPSAPPEKAPAASRFSYQQPAAEPDPNMQTMPIINPAGHSFTALDSDVGKPKGLTPLPGISGPQQLSAKKPAALVQLPPWLSDSPQPFNLLQRAF